MTPRAYSYLPAIVNRNFAWGLYVRILDRDRIWESWLWGLYRRCTNVVLLAELQQISEETRSAFNAIGGALNTPEEARALESDDEAEVFAQMVTGRKRSGSLR